jgi:hypothetical protein
MRQAISNDTDEVLEMDGSMKTDIGIGADGEGGIFLTMCWHEMLTLGSIVARIEPDKVQGFIESIKKASKDVD